MTHNELSFNYWDVIARRTWIPQSCMYHLFFINICLHLMILFCFFMILTVVRYFALQGKKTKTKQKANSLFALSASKNNNTERNSVTSKRPTHKNSPDGDAWRLTLKWSRGSLWTLKSVFAGHRENAEYPDSILTCLPPRIFWHEKNQAARWAAIALGSLPVDHQRDDTRQK